MGLFGSSPPSPVPAAEPAHFTLVDIRSRDAKVSAQMFERIAAAGREAERRARETGVPVPPRAIRHADDSLDEDALLAAVCDWPFISSLNHAIRNSGGAISEVGADQPATLLANDCFLPAGFALDAGFQGAEALYVFVRKSAATRGKPYLPHDFLTRMQAFFDLFAPLRRPLRLVLVWMPQDILNRVISHVYFNQPLLPVAATAAGRASDEPLSVDVQSGDDAVIRQARLWIRESIFRHASDIHVEPGERSGRIRIRVHGVLEQLASDIPPGVLVQFITWVKAQADMDISDNRRPLDGSIRLSYTDSGKVHVLDVRISSIPVVHGQKMVLRLLDPDALGKLSRQGLAGAIWDKGLLRRFETALATRDGIVLVTGPTGSGKTTTLNISLLHLLKVEGDKKNIVTIEDPVEYTIPGANQTQVNEAAGVSFASTLRSLLRQDPDIMLVGEIRDSETAQIAVQAALTGHLILATLHTNDSLGSVARMQDLGVTPFLLASTLRLVQAQRLVRRFCEECGRDDANRIPAEVLPDRLSHSRLRPYLPVLTAPDAAVYRPGGCIRCNGRGYDGRIAVMEMAASSPELVAAIEKDLPSRELEAVARAHSGFRPMIENAIDMVAAGITSLEEVASISLKDLASEE